MPNTKRKDASAKKQTTLPDHFESLEQAAEFWDAHDSADYEEQMTEVECEVKIGKKTFLVALDDGLYRKVRAIARKKGVPAETLVNRWIEEKAS